MELIGEEDGYLEDLQRELQMIADSKEEIDSIIEVVVVENLVDTVSKIVHEGVKQRY